MEELATTYIPKYVQYLKKNLCAYYGVKLPLVCQHTSDTTINIIRSHVCDTIFKDFLYNLVICNTEVYVTKINAHTGTIVHFVKISKQELSDVK